MFKWNIRNQILSTGILAFLVVVAVIYSFYNFSTAQFIESTDSIIELSGKQYTSELSDLFQSQSGEFKNWIKDDVYGLAIEFETTSEFHNEFVKRLSNSNGFATMMLIDNNGRIIEIAGAKGLGGSVAGLKGQMLSDFDQLRHNKSDAVVFLESKLMPQINNGLIESYVFYHPAVSSDNKQNGAYIAYTDWNRVIGEVENCASNLGEIGLKETRVMFAFQKSGNVPIHTSFDKADFPENKTNLLVAWSNTAQNNVVGEVDIDGMQMLSGMNVIEAPSISSAEAESPILITAIDESAVTQNINSMVLKIVIWAILGTMIALGASYYVARSISARISQIGQIAEEIAMGDIDHDINIKSNDEVGQLGKSFNKLIMYMNSLAEAAKDIADNNLTVSITPRSESDALGNSFKTMVSNLTDIVGHISKNANSVVTAATEISSSSDEMAKGARGQTEMATQISAAIEEMTATIVESSTHANDARELAENASTTAASGQTIVGATIKGMLMIADSAADSSMIVNELASASDKIGEIISVIDDIADQTNLLALNAAIEAARAGEQGRGFAVVADEVRKLAERTGKATGEITEMIKGIQEDSARAVESMEDAGKLVEEGKGKADEAGNSLNEINSISARVMEMIAQIATASGEQSAAAEQISRNMVEIATVSQQTASGAAQSASAAEDLNKQAEGLKEIVERFKINA
ncbi:MAG: HAMP domain-containing protein [candidate division Zixibacteria bacterium]|nr:HAMP domain-containing protein [candidate division Zixibacteria bacterium]